MMYASYFYQILLCFLLGACFTLLYIVGGDGSKKRIMEKNGSTYRALIIVYHQYQNINVNAITELKTLFFACDLTPFFAWQRVKPQAPWKNDSSLEFMPGRHCYLGFLVSQITGTVVQFRERSGRDKVRKVLSNVQIFFCLHWSM